MVSKLVVSIWVGVVIGSLFYIHSLTHKVICVRREFLRHISNLIKFKKQPLQNRAEKTAKPLDLRDDTQIVAAAHLCQSAIEPVQRSFAEQALPLA